MKLYRIYTEDKNRDKIEKAANHMLGDYTLIQGMGYWKGSKENTIIIEQISRSDWAAPMTFLAKAIKELNHQEAVLLTWQEIDSRLI